MPLKLNSKGVRANSGYINIVTICILCIFCHVKLFVIYNFLQIKKKGIDKGKERWYTVITTKRAHKVVNQI